MKLIGPSVQRQSECEAVLRTLPEWFGIEDALQTYARNSALLPTFAFDDSSQLIGFVSLREHFPTSWEIDCIAVAAHYRNAGLGSRLLAQAEHWALGQGARYLQVKTLAPSACNSHYEQTHKFYLARGYTPIEVFPKLWAPWNPALMLIKRLEDRGNQ